jgi:hypothetical protein
VGYLGFAHRHPGTMRTPSSGDRKTDAANAQDSFSECCYGGFIYPILTAAEDGQMWNISWYYMPRWELDYFPFAPRIVEAPALPMSWNTSQGYRVQGEMGCLRECAETF